MTSKTTDLETRRIAALRRHVIGEALANLDGESRAT